ncbi:hypothetical protein [Verrucosispora sp. WMMD573]|uniref:hypothetical protein n=1 Tax=Verrucosispora sp. WMMD573 TaxID=3015149 RepID=UPI00248AC252|nr:hypothetical protein [Verrucosispora sp. WMMD573]WBB55590.1 hypothetical protein O7601_05630 [Verrucosispora sp. WMMD573]
MSPPSDGERAPEDAVLHGVARRLDKPMGALGVLFVLIVLAQVVELVPAIYSMVVFGTLAGAFGALFLSADRERKATAT